MYVSALACRNWFSVSQRTVEASQLVTKLIIRLHLRNSTFAGTVFTAFRLVLFNLLIVPARIAFFIYTRVTSFVIRWESFYRSL